MKATQSFNVVEVNAAANWNFSSSFALGKGKRGVYWGNEEILILTPASAVPAPKPSFACNTNNNATETAICHDATLARWDRSVQTAYAWSQKKGAPAAFVPQLAQDALESSQREWLIHRNKCGRDAPCLIETMLDRMTDLLTR